MTLVTTQTNPMLLVGATGDVLHTAADLDDMDESERQVIMARMTAEERDAVRERDARKMLAAMSDSVNAAMEIGLTGDELESAIADLRGALAIGWNNSNDGGGSSMGLQVNTDVEVAMMLLEDHDSRGATSSANPAYHLSLRRLEMRSLSLALRDHTAAHGRHQRVPMVFNATARALAAPEAFVAVRYKETTDGGGRV